MEVGGAGGRGVVVIPEGPGESPVTRCCAPVNRHVGREGGETGKCTCDMGHLLVMKTCGQTHFIRQAFSSENSHARKSHVHDNENMTANRIVCVPLANHTQCVHNPGH